MSDDTEFDFDDILCELKEIKKEEEEIWEQDIIKSTISSLLAVEKDALYGSLRWKNKNIDEIISTAINSRKV